ncbi:Mss4-like protein [Mycena leptocephala]|nr:Mss4-like protein [Mycena leptocephala]
MPHHGACLCGQITIEIKSTHSEQVVCHCSDCKRASGSAFSTNVLVANKDLIITGPVKEYLVVAASGSTVRRVFCGNCGSAIVNISPGLGDSQAIQTGNFADFANVPITTEIFVKDRWAGLEPIHDADQVPAMPANVQDLAT